MHAQAKGIQDSKILRHTPTLGYATANMNLECMQMSVAKHDMNATATSAGNELNTNA